MGNPDVAHLVFYLHGEWLYDHKRRPRPIHRVGPAHGAGFSDYGIVLDPCRDPPTHLLVASSVVSTP